MNWRKPVIFALLYISGSKIPRNLKIIRKLSKSSRSEIKKYQEEKLKNILLHAYKNVPYYNKILPESGVITKTGGVNLKKFSKIPTLTKDIIRKEADSLYSKDYKKRGQYKNTSGGSTGEPVEFIQDKGYSDWNIANKIFIKSVYGQDVGEREMRLWGSERDIIEGRDSLKNRFRNWLYNRKDLNSFRLNRSKLKNCILEWNSFKPSWIEAYVQSADELVRFAKDNSYTLEAARGILVSAGKLYPEIAANISSGTGSKVIDRYGSREVGDIAFSCVDSYKMLHVCMWNNLVEFLEQDKKTGVSGACVTNLNNYSMPLIRYKIGDMIKPVEYKCDRCKTQIIGEIVGREVSFLRNCMGELIDGEYFTHLFYNKSWVKKFKIVQNELDELIIYFVGSNGREIDKLDKAKINQLIKIVMGKDCKIVWVKKNSITETKSGKHVYVVNNLKNT